MILQNLLYQPLPEFLSAAVHRDLRLAVTPPHGDVARSTAVRLELAAVGGKEPFEDLPLCTRLKRTRTITPASEG